MGKRRDLRNERELIEACIEGETAAQKALFQRYAPKLLGVCARYCENMEDARDALHDGFVKIFTQINRFNFQSRLETWMTRVIINTAIDKFKSGTRFNLYDDHEAILNLDEENQEANDHYDEGGSPDMNTLLALIQELPDGYRLVFNLYALEGYSHREIADELGIAEGTSKSQLARARQLLREKIKEKGILER